MLVGSQAAPGAFEDRQASSSSFDSFHESASSSSRVRGALLCHLVR